MPVLRRWPTYGRPESPFRRRVAEVCSSYETSCQKMTGFALTKDFAELSNLNLDICRVSTSLASSYE